jgi:hypothetical protein
MRKYVRVCLGVILCVGVSLPVYAGQFSALISAAALATRPSPSPTPTPAPSDVCENCNGTGKLGDGTVFVPCPICGGDGRLNNAASSPLPSDGRSVAVSNGQPAVRMGQALTEADLSADQMPTPMAAIGDALRALNPRGKVFVDIGCGFDCRAGIVAVRDFGAARVIAVERDPAIADSARRYVDHAGLTQKIQVITADAAAVEFPAGAVAFAYLWESELVKLRPKLQKLDAFVSFAHAVPGLQMQRSGDLFVYRKPTASAVMQTFRKLTPSAVYNGRTYSRPVCNSRNCSMCNAIRRGLGWR